MPIVSSPSAGAVHIDSALTNFAIKWMQDSSKFVAGEAFPMVTVQHQSDKYHEFDLESWLNNAASRRADGDPAPQGGWKMSEGTYFCDVWSFAKPVTDRQRANQDSAINLERSATAYVTQKLLMAREVVMQERLFAPNLWYNGTDAAHGGQDVNWSDEAIDPVAQIRRACEGVESKTGIMPNRLLLSRKAWNVLRDSDAIREYIVGGATTGMPAVVSRALVAQALDLDMVHVAGAVTRKQAASTGQFTSADYVFGANALVYYAPEMNMGVEGVTGGTQFSWMAPFNGGSELAIKMFRDEMTASDVIEGNAAFDFKLTAPELGHLFINVAN